MRRLLIVGMVLMLVVASVTPAFAQSSTVHIVQRGENLYRIALRYGITYQALAAANGIANPNRIYVGQRLVIPGSSSGSSPPSQPPASGQTYTVRRGDTLSAIALRYGVSMWTLARVNGIQNPSFIYVGQVLRIPGGGSRSVRLGFDYGEFVSYGRVGKHSRPASFVSSRRAAPYPRAALHSDETSGPSERLRGEEKMVVVGR